jgi:hypothetical protein
MIDRTCPASHAYPTPSCLRFTHFGHARRHAELPTPPHTAAAPGIERFRVEIPHLFRDRCHAEPPTVRDRIDAELPTRPRDGAGSRQPSGTTAPGVAPKYIRPPARPGESRRSPASGRRIIRGRRGESVRPAQASAGLIPGETQPVVLGFVERGLGRRESPTRRPRLQDSQPRSDDGPEP